MTPEKTVKEIAKRHGVHRSPGCIFHGRTLTALSPDAIVTIATGGNQCGLMTSSFAPCIMDPRPDWPRCPRNPELHTFAEKPS
jgi:hypothetical protein